MAASVETWEGLVVLCGANPWSGVKLADHHLAERLAARGVPVLYVDPPMSPLTPLRRPARRDDLHGPRLRVERRGLARLTTVVLPGPERPGMARLTAPLVRRALRRSVRRLGGPSVRAVVATSTTIPMLGAVDEQLRVWWAQDDFVAGAELFGMAASRIRRGAVRMAEAADLVVASNPEIEARWRAHGCRTALVPFGCDAATFAATDTAPLPGDVTLSPPVAGFVGHLNDRIDLRLLEAIAGRGRSLLLVGPRHDGHASDRLDALLARPNVLWVGPRPFEALPSYERVIDVGLVPYADTAFNRGSFPLKTLEYLAAGRPVVATDLPGIRWLATDLVSVASDPPAFAAAVDRELDTPRTAAAVARRRAFAAAHSWDVRAADFARVLGIEEGIARSTEPRVAAGAGVAR